MRNCFVSGARRVFVPAAAALIVAAAWIAPASLGSPAPGTPGADSLQARQKDLAKLKSELEANRRKLEELKAKEKDLSKHTERLKENAGLTRRYLSELLAQDRALREDLASRQADDLETRLRYDDTAARMRERLLRYYKIRRVHGAELLLSSRSFDELFARAAFLARLIQRDRLDLLALGQDRERIGQEAALLDSRRRGIEALQEEKRREEERLRAEAREAREQLADVREEQKAHEARVKELERSEAAIRRMLVRLAQERAAKGKPQQAPPGFRPRGLLWPVEGKVTAEFGFEEHPIYHTRTPMNGIEIAAAHGASIRSAAAGTAIYVNWLPGYGNTVIIDHGGGYFTLYAHASEILVARGESVAAGQAVARVGDTDSIRGDCLHFEVRHQEEALNPREWLR